MSIQAAKTTSHHHEHDKPHTTTSIVDKRTPMLALSKDRTPPFLELVEVPVDLLVPVPVAVYAVEGRGAMLGVGVVAGDVPVVVPLISTERDGCQMSDQAVVSHALTYILQT
jgi:hypothetical protein